ncbi:MAG: hypothetical protein WB791_11580 [Waddliaceae bacterium]
MDFMIETKKSGHGPRSVFSIECSKLKDGEQWEQKIFRLVKVEGTQSVAISWMDSIEGRGERGEMETHIEKILNLMLEYQETKFAVNSIAEVIGETPKYTRKLLSTMVDDGRCSRVLKDDDKPSSNRNPFLYWIL